MPFLNCTTFNVAADNEKAAAAFVKRLKAEGFEAELVDGHPGAVSHNAPSDVSVPLADEIESADPAPKKSDT